MCTQKIGTICLILESLLKTHALHIEKAEHGFFLKCHCKRQALMCTVVVEKLACLESQPSAHGSAGDCYFYRRGRVLKSAQVCKTVLAWYDVRCR